jgi:large subunit ribosomal protein L13
MKTFLPNVKELEHRWHIVDAEGKVLGRLASAVAHILRGKHKPDFTPFLDMGDYVVVINAEKVIVTGNKSQSKEYSNYSGYPGGLHTASYKEMMEKYPERVIYHAVKGMLPKNKLGTKMLSRLKVYRGGEHPHAAQNPEQLSI